MKHVGAGVSVVSIVNVHIFPLHTMRKQSREANPSAADELKRIGQERESVYASKKMLGIKVTDLATTENDPLARALRRILREKYAFPSEGLFGIPTVFSTEPVIEPVELHYDGGKGFKCVCPQGQNGLNDCDMKNLIMGNAGFVTGTFGNICAGVVVKDLVS